MLQPLAHYEVGSPFGTRESFFMFISKLQKNQAGVVGVVTRLRGGWPRYHGWFRDKRFL